jgi:hypothetical protein
VGAGRGPQGPLILDLDATLVDAHSDKQGAAPTYKHDFGFHPLAAYLDRGDGTGEAYLPLLSAGDRGSPIARGPGAAHVGHTEGTASEEDRSSGLAVMAPARPLGEAGLRPHLPRWQVAGGRQASLVGQP